MSSPLARRHQLATTLLALRTEAGLTHRDLAAKAGVSQATVSRLENPTAYINRKLSVSSVDKVLAGLGVVKYSEVWRELHEHAEAGADDGWWDAPVYAQMGEGQRTAAVIESGASQILEYANALLPGLVQTRDYAAYRAEVGDIGDDAPVNVDAIVAGRLRRQAESIIAGVPYRLVVEEQVIRRRAAPPPVMAEQLYHLVKLAERPNVSIRIVPVAGDVANGVGATAREPFAIVSYRQVGAPQIVTVDASSGTSVLTGVKAVAGYARLHERLCSAALPDARSAAVICEVADQMAAKT